MAYGPRAKRARRSGTSRRASAVKTIQAAARKRAFTKARGGLKSVSRIQRQPYAPRVVKNTASIAQLSRAVRTLQKQQIGAAQKRITVFTYTPSATPPQVSFDQMTPLAICLQDMAYNANVYQSDVSSGFSVAGNFVRQNVWNAGNIYDMWQNANDDSVSTERFLPTYIEFLLEFEVTMAASDETQVVRIDIVKPNKVLQKTTGGGGHNLTLPDGLPAFQRLADERISTQQKLNPEYFRKQMKTRYIKFKNSESPSNARVIRKVVKVTHKFKPKIIDCDIQTGQSFLHNMDPSDLSWLILSHSEAQKGDVNYRMKLDIRRTCYWRDQHGVAA